MRRVVLVVCVVALAGCGSSGGKATVTRSELPTTVLQQADVPGSWTQFADEKQARIDTHPGPRQSPTRFGREDGWISRYRGTEHGSAVVVESRADVFESVGGAKKDLDAYRDEIKAGVPDSGATTKLLSAPALGDGSVAGELRQGPSVFIVLAWRRANETASVTKPRLRRPGLSTSGTSTRGTRWPNARRPGVRSTGSRSRCRTCCPTLRRRSRTAAATSG